MLTTLPKRSSVPVFRISTRATELIWDSEGESIALSFYAMVHFVRVERCREGSPACESKSVSDQPSEDDLDARSDFDEIKSERNRWPIRSFLRGTGREGCRRVGPRSGREG